MDIKAVQAEASTKATEWLSANLQVDGGNPPPPAAPPVVAPPAAAPVQAAPVEPAQVVPAKPGLADAIRRDRDARASNSTAQVEANKLRAEAEALRKENEALKSVSGATDPFEFLRGRKLTKEQQALWGQAFLYDLKPEVAPQDFRLDLYKAEQARKEAERAEAAQRAATEEAQQAEKAHLDRYASDLFQHVQASPGSNPESELWFSEDGPDGNPQVNHRAYAQSLFATANNLATQAQKTGQQADLSPANIARVLEAEVSKRLKRRDAKMAGNAKTEQKQGAPVAPVPGGTQAAKQSITMSASGLGGGAPIPPAQTDEERRQRAAAVLFGAK
jgi:hypothetical protein